jgi:hypothetical protein
MLRHAEVPTQVDLEDIVPELFACFEGITVSDHARVGQDDVQPPHRRRHLAYKAFDRRLATHIGQYEHDPFTARGCDLSSRARTLVGTIAAGHNVSPGKGKLPGGG